MSEEIVDFDDLVGQEFDFYGVDGNCFKLDDTTYEFIDDNDCYSIGRVSQPITGLPIARVVVELVVHGIYEIIDLHDDHSWLSFGITSACDCCASTFFDYSPKAPPQ